jgi:hypothetical protein
MMWNTDHIHCTSRHDVEDEMTAFGEAKITRHYLIPWFASGGVVGQPIQPSKYGLI